MIIETDVTCLCCGYVSWRVEMEREQPWQMAEVLWPEPGTRLPSRPRCRRCGGPVFLDQEYRQVRIRHRDWQALVKQVQDSFQRSPRRPARSGRAGVARARRAAGTAV